MSKIRVDQLEALESEVVKNVDELLIQGDLDALDQRLLDVENSVETVSANVKEFGAVGDGVANDTVAIQNAVDSFNNQGGRLTFPKGTYLITGPITITGKALTVVGEGSSSSIIYAQNCSSFTVNNSTLSDKERFTVAGLGFETSSDGLHTAIGYTGKPGSSLGAQLTVRYCAFTGRENNLAWNYPINMTDAKFSEISSNYFRGNTSDLTKTSASILVDNSTDVKISKNYFYWCNYGVRITGFSEGIEVEGSHFVPVNRGVSHKGTGNLVWVNDNHISANLVAVELGTTGVVSVNHCQVHNNLIFKRSTSTNNFVAIALFSKRHAVSGNEVLIPGGFSTGGTQNGIVLYSDSAMCRVVGNQLANMDTGIVVNSGSDNNTVVGNTFLSCNNNVITDGTNTNTGTLSASSLVYLSSDFSTSTSTLVAVPWSAEFRDSEGLWASSAPTRLTVPSKAQKVKLSANITFGANSSGERLVEIRKNGSAVATGLGRQRTVATGSSDINITTAILDVNPTDYFEVYVRQTSGGALAVSSSASTWFEIEIKE